MVKKNQSFLERVEEPVESRPCAPRRGMVASRSSRCDSQCRGVAQWQLLQRAEFQKPDQIADEPAKRKITASSS